MEGAPDAVTTWPAAERTSLRDAEGLCLFHFVQATRCADAPTRVSLLTNQQKAWTVLAADLEEIIRKQMEHHYTEPIIDQARLAVERALAGLPASILSVNLDVDYGLDLLATSVLP